MSRSAARRAPCRRRRTRSNADSGRGGPSAGATLACDASPSPVAPHSQSLARDAGPCKRWGPCPRAALGKACPGWLTGGVPNASPLNRAGHASLRKVVDKPPDRFTRRFAHARAFFAPSAHEVARARPCTPQASSPAHLVFFDPPSRPRNS